MAFAPAPVPVPAPYPAPRLPNPASLPVGLKFCPAPGADNREFNSSYYAIDAQTGRMSRYMDGVPRDEPFGAVETEEQVLYVSPPINVENRYVPYPGAAPQTPPPEFRHAQRQQPRQQVRQPRQPRQMRQPPQQQVAGAQVQAQRQRQEGRLPWWKAVLH